MSTTILMPIEWISTTERLPSYEDLRDYPETYNQILVVMQNSRRVMPVSLYLDRSDYTVYPDACAWGDVAAWAVFPSLDEPIYTPRPIEENGGIDYSYSRPYYAM